MSLWSMDQWRYLEREVVTDPKSRQWTVALMDVLGQEGDPELPTISIVQIFPSGWITRWTLTVPPSSLFDACLG